MHSLTTTYDGLYWVKSSCSCGEFVRSTSVSLSIPIGDAREAEDIEKIRQRHTLLHQAHKLTWLADEVFA